MDSAFLVGNRILDGSAILLGIPWLGLFLEEALEESRLARLGLPAAGARLDQLADQVRNLFLEL